MAVNVKLEFDKTYFSVKNAERAVSKAVEGIRDSDQLRYMIIPVVQDDNSIRYGVMFLGDRAIQAGMHLRFNCVVVPESSLQCFHDE